MFARPITFFSCCKDETRWGREEGEMRLLLTDTYAHGRVSPWATYLGYDTGWSAGFSLRNPAADILWGKDEGGEGKTRDRGTGPYLPRGSLSPQKKEIA